MRKIQYRGKDVETKSWIFGGYTGIDFNSPYPYNTTNKYCIVVKEKIKDSICPPIYNFCEVDPETVGQGLYIDDDWYYEGDILYNEINKKYYILIWDEMGFALRCEHGIIMADIFRGLKKVGNVYDNSELVEWFKHK